LSHIKIKFNYKEIGLDTYLSYEFECSVDFLKYYNDKRFTIKDNIVKSIKTDSEIVNNFRVCIGGTYDPSSLYLASGSRFTIRKTKSEYSLKIKSKEETDKYIKNILICLKVLSENVGK
jgi:hypothetical protein